MNSHESHHSAALQVLSAEIGLAEILAVSAFSAEPPQSRTAWLQACVAAGIFAHMKRAPNGLAFEAILGRLVELQLVSNDRGAYLIMPHGLSATYAILNEYRKLAPLASRIDAAARRSSEGSIPALRRAIAMASLDLLNRAISQFRYRYSDDLPFAAALVRALGLAPPMAWVVALPRAESYEYLRENIAVCCDLMIAPAAIIVELAKACDDHEIRATLAVWYVLAGDTAKANLLLAPLALNDPWARAGHAIVALGAGNLSAAREWSRPLDIGTRKGAARISAELRGIAALLVMLLIATDDNNLDRSAFAYALKSRRSRALERWPNAQALMAEIVAYGLSAPPESAGLEQSSLTWVEAMLEALAIAWTGAVPAVGFDYPPSTPVALRLASFARAAEERGLAWLSARLAELAAADDSAAQLVRLRNRAERWEIALGALEATMAPAASSAAKPLAGKIVWRLQVNERMRTIEVSCVHVTERSRTGKAVSLARVSDPFSELGSREDQLVATALASARRLHGHVPFSVLRVFVNHPHVADGVGEPIHVSMAAPTLHLEPYLDGIRMRMQPSAFGADGLALEVGPGKILVYEETAQVTSFQRTLGSAGLCVPASGVARLTALASQLGTAFALNAPVGAAAQVAPHAVVPVVQLFRGRTGDYRVRLRVRPLGAAAAAFRPGEPPAQVVASIDGKLVQCTRDLAAEFAAVVSFEDAAPVFASLARSGDERLARDLPTCLELLLELSERGAVVEWPEGKPLKSPTLRSGTDIKVSFKGKGEWFESQIQLQVDAAVTLDMQQLLANATKAEGRFLRIGEDEYIALTQELNERVTALLHAQSLATKSGLSVALLPAMAALADGLDVSYTKALETRKASLDKALGQVPKLPRGLMADLRDYQQDGFVFLARRASAGLGALLADDMGLGKTVQALALLLHRAKLGPALVVAPTSVASNWQAEAIRFAPSLNIIRVAENDREAAMAAAKAGDVLLLSYGLLVVEQERLAQIRFSTVVFDEAHALKNATTKRAVAARAMLSDATVALTGTPIENRLAELHALIDLVVPGMLGTRKVFDSVFDIAPPEAQRRALTTLRGLVRPLVLRRTKSDVLTELPPKTEITRLIPPSAAHLAFYETVRLQAALAANSAAGPKGRAGNAHIQILAEITRLRRAAIDPRLVAGGAAPAGGKFAVLAEIVEELRNEGHRVLVFSQFLEVLDHAREALENAAVRCVRLDGTMNSTARTAAIAAFQEGEADVFLLSLKAGGVGLNLTAADYVIHLDPWWNPAVEDQASDRAHRIGQSRPVTVMRLVTEGTIEEKVLALHRSKRDLYEQVVGGADGQGTLDVAVLVELLGN